MRNLRNRDGFTLIELMIVVVIIGILAAIAIPRFSSVSKNAKQAEAYPVLKQLCTLQKSHFEQKDVYASSQATLSGWADPGAKYFTFTSAGTTNTAATATAEPTDAGKSAKVSKVVRDCLTGLDTETATT
jgi:prepilin-type N-terminal cleavage/methylation domain-containing protein